MARVCIIRQFYFPLDTRVRREVDSLVAAGHEVDIVCLKRPDQRTYERTGMISVWRLPIQKQHRGLLRYVFEYVTFFLAASVLCSALHLRRRYDLVQVNSLPDPLVFAAVVPRLLGARVLLDLHECMPEFFASKFKTAQSHPLVMLLTRLEQSSIRFSDLAITCSEQMAEAFVSRGTSPDKISVVFNGTDESIFDHRRFPQRERQADRFELISHGSIEERYGLDTLVRAVALLKPSIPGLRVRIHGEGSYVEELRHLVADLNVGQEVILSDRFVPLEELVRAIAQADAGVVAMKRDPFRDLTLCNKMYDFIAMRRPAVVSRTRSVEEAFGDSSFQMFESENEADLARAILELYSDPHLGDRLVDEALRASAPHRWALQRERYLEIVERLIGHAKRGRQMETRS